MFLLIVHFDGGTDDGTDDGTGGDEPVGSAEAIRLLGDQPATRSLRWARSTEQPGRWAMVAEFDTAAAFRAAQSPVAVRAALIPWLAGASSSAAFEVVGAADAGRWAVPDVVVDDLGRSSSGSGGGSTGPLRQ